MFECKRGDASDAEFDQAIEQACGNRASLGAAYCGAVSGRARRLLRFDNYPPGERDRNHLADVPARYGKPPEWRFYKNAKGKDLAAVPREDLRDPDDRARMAREIAPDRLANNWLTNFTRPRNAKYDGRLITDIAEMRGQEPAEALFDLLLEENLGISTVGLGTNAQTLAEFVSHPAGMIASDAILFGEHPNPRTYGCFPIVLAEFVRAEKRLRLPEAIRKMTSFPAQRLGLRDRGILRDGFKADIVIFDPNEVKTRATRENPKRYPAGIDWVIVNGEPVIANGENTGALPGRSLRRGRD